MELTGKERCAKRIGRGAALALAILLVLPLAANVSAQDEVTGKVYGYVYGDSGDYVIMIYPPVDREMAIEGANVSIRMSALGMTAPSKDTKTDEKGYFEFDGLLAGDYEIIVSAEGYKEYYETFSVAAGDNKSLGKFVLNRKYEEPAQPAPDARIYGYVKDSKTGEGIKGVSLSISGGTGGTGGEVGGGNGGYGGMPYYGGYNYTYTDGNGYYEMGCWSGENWISAYEQSGDYNSYNSQISISPGDNEWNIKLEKKPEKTVKVSGYVYDASTGAVGQNYGE